MEELPAVPRDSYNISQPTEMNPEQLKEQRNLSDKLERYFDEIKKTATDLEKGKAKLVLTNKGGIEQLVKKRIWLFGPRGKSPETVAAFKSILDTAEKALKISSTHVLPSNLNDDPKIRGYEIKHYPLIQLNYAKGYALMQKLADPKNKWAQAVMKRNPDLKARVDDFTVRHNLAVISNHIDQGKFSQAKVELEKFTKNKKLIDRYNKDHPQEKIKEHMQALLEMSKLMSPIEKEIPAGEKSHPCHTMPKALKDFIEKQDEIQKKRTVDTVTKFLSVLPKENVLQKLWHRNLYKVLKLSE